MTTTTTTQTLRRGRTTRTPSARRGRVHWPLGRRSAFALLASVAISLLASSSAPTPLYALYRADWGLSEIALTVVFGVYALAVLSALLVVGSLSDHLGRRPILVGALVTQVAVMVLFALAHGLDVLLVARVLQGLATGTALGAIGAGLVDVDETRGPLANSAALMAGTAGGALVSALFVQLLPAPTLLIYLTLAAVFALQAVALMGIEETSPRIPGARRSLAPTLVIPTRVQPALLVAAPALVAVWVLAGFFLTLGPSLTGLVTGSHSAILGGATVFDLAGSGGLTVLVFHRTEAQRFSLIGTSLIIVGVLGLLWAVAERSTPGFFLATAVAGGGFGAGFQGAVRTILPLAALQERAGVMSVIYVISYLALGLPAILAGVLVADGTLIHTANAFGAGVVVLAAATLLSLAVSMTRRHHRNVSRMGRPVVS